MPVTRFELATSWLLIRSLSPLGHTVNKHSQTLPLPGLISLTKNSLSSGIGSFRFIWVHVGPHRFIWVHMGSFSFTWVHMGLIGSHGLTCVHMSSHGFTWVHLGSHGFTWVHLGPYGFTSSGTHLSQQRITDGAVVEWNKLRLRGS